MGTKLTPNQSRFVLEYPKDLNGTQAAIRAGYSAKGAEVTASKLLRITKVQEALKAALVLQAERTQIDADWVIEKLVANVEMAMRARPVRDRQGEETGEYVYDGPVANKALETLGRHLRMFPEGPGMVVDNRSQYVVGDGGAVEALKKIILERQERSQNLNGKTNGRISDEAN